MLASQIGYYSLIFGLIFSILIIPISIKNFKTNQIIDNRIFLFSFLQLFFVLISYFFFKSINFSIISDKKSSE